jgi:hypothetical protein
VVRDDQPEAREGQAGRLGESGRFIVCAGQRVNHGGLSPLGARMRGAVSKGGSNASLAGKGRQVWRSLNGHEGESRTQPRRT